MHIEANTGLKVSYDKTVLYRIGSIADSDAKIYTQKELRWSNSVINTLGFDLYHNNLDRNLDKAIIKMKMVAHMWFYRHLSLNGKVLIINALMGSLLVYRLQLLHCIAEEKYQQIEQVFKEFLWSGRGSKLPMSVVMKPKDKGGLGVFDIRAKHSSLLLKWAQACCTNWDIAVIAEYNLGIKDINMLLKANISFRDSEKLFSCHNFWGKLMQTWCSYNYYEPQNANVVSGQLIWYNSLIKKNGKIFKNLIDSKAGLNYVEQLWCAEQNRFYSFDEIKKCFDIKMTWLEYASLIDAIPDYWKFLLRKEESSSF